MKKYIVPTINVQRIELTEMIAASPEFISTPELPTPTVGSSSDKELPEGPGHNAEGNAKSYNVWEAWED